MIGDELRAAMDGIQEDSRRKNNPAGYMLERARELVKDFEITIGNDAEVGMSVAGAAAGAPIRLRSISVSNPDMLIFDGIDDNGAIVRLVQHHSQMSVLLVAIPKLQEKPFRIGIT